MNYLRALLVLLTTLSMMGCAPMRQPIPAGTIPKPPILTQEDEQYGHDVLSELSEQYELELDDKKVSRVRDIVDTLTKSIGADKDPWHVYVFRDPSVKNAAATRGNHIFVWSGMLDMVTDDQELSVIIAHEIAHVLADHPTPSEDEQTISLISQIIGTIAQNAIIYNGGHTSIADLTGDLTSSTLSGFMVNPESQRKELEADVIGMHLLAEAGIDPRLAVRFWEKNLNNPELNSGLPQFFSSHPTSKDRLEQIKLNLPGALKRYQDSKKPTW